MSKEADALQDLLKAGKRFLDAVKPEPPKRPEPPVGSRDTWARATAAAAASPLTYVVPKDYLDKVFEAMDDPQVEAITPHLLWKRLESLRARVGRG